MSGYSVSVFDGEQWVLSRSTDTATILSVLASTDEDLLAFRNGDEKVGEICLVYGNGPDLFHDWTDNLPTNRLLTNALKIAETL